MKITKQNRHENLTWDQHWQILKILKIQILKILKIQHNGTCENIAGHIVLLEGKWMRHLLSCNIHSSSALSASLFWIGEKHRDNRSSTVFKKRWCDCYKKNWTCSMARRYFLERMRVSIPIDTCPSLGIGKLCTYCTGTVFIFCLFCVCTQWRPRWRLCCRRIVQNFLCLS